VVTFYQKSRPDQLKNNNKTTTNKQINKYTAILTLLFFSFQLSLDGSLIHSDMMEIKDVWLLHASNVPRAGDSCVPHPGRDQ